MWYVTICLNSWTEAKKSLDDEAFLWDLIVVVVVSNSFTGLPVFILKSDPESDPDPDPDHIIIINSVAHDQGSPSPVSHPLRLIR